MKNDLLLNETIVRRIAVKKMMPENLTIAVISGTHSQYRQWLEEQCRWQESHPSFLSRHFIYVGEDMYQIRGLRIHSYITIGTWTSLKNIEEIISYLTMQVHITNDIKTVIKYIEKPSFFKRVYNRFFIYKD